MESLTKENFWNEIEQKYPKATAHFKEWVDRYKSENNWNTLFSNEFEGDRAPEHLPKYHELPLAVQFGIFCYYYSEQCLKLEWLYNNSGLYNLSRGIYKAMKQYISTNMQILESVLKRKGHPL